MKKINALALGSLVAFALPLISSAQTVSNITTVGQFIINLINNVFVPVLFAVAFLVFLWGAFDAFILGANNEEKKDHGKNLMLWGLIGFFVMVSVWGLVNILTGSVSFGNNTGPSGGTPGTGVQVR